MKKMKKSLSLLLALGMSLQILPFSACGITEQKKEIEKYDVAVTSSAGGSLVADVKEVEQGKDVTFTITANEGYILESLIINGGKVAVSGSTYVFAGVICDLDVKAVFVEPDVTVNFKTDGAPVASVSAQYGKTFGELPSATAPGKRFLYWKNEKGEQVRPTSIVSQSGEVTLEAVWQDITEEEKAGLVPFGATTAYYDMAATKYGVVFHTDSEPITPQILVAENNTGDFTNAKVVDCDYEPWFNEYVINGVVDGLKYDTEYSVKFGDYSADVWGKTYTFKTRKEEITETQFYYVADSQETHLINNKQSPYQVIGDTYWSVTMTDARARFPEADFIAHGGDIVNHAAEPEYWQEMFDSIEEYLFQYPLMITPGNHEGDGWYSAGYECVGKMFNMNVISNTEMGFFYSFDYGPMHFVSILSNDIYYHYDGMYTAEQLAWLRADLAAASANPETKWIVAMTHQGILIPTHTEGKMTSNDYSTLTYPQIMPIFDEYNVDLLLYAHNHYIDSSYPILWSGEVEKTMYDSYVKRDVDYYRIDLATTTTKKTLHDGVEVDEFVYPQGTTRRGTVMHQTGTVGDQYNNTYKLSELTENLAAAKYYRMLLSGGKNAVDTEASYSMYSYVEVTANKLVCRTYGVNVPAQIASPSLENGKYLDGFMLTK